MPRTGAGATLTDQHRRGQLQIRARALRDFTRLWPMWRGDDESFRSLANATLPLVRVYHQLSSSLAAGYYEAFRLAEGVGGAPTPRVADALDEGEVVGTLIVTGERMTQTAIASGLPPEPAMREALVRTSGTVTRLSLKGGRDTLTQSVQTDPQARGWGRVTSGDPCAFCAMLASRGPSYSEQGVDFEAHDHCGCMAEPFYEGAEWPGRGREFKDLYNQAQREARASGEGASGTANDALNNFRRLLGD